VGNTWIPSPAARPIDETTHKNAAVATSAKPGNEGLLVEGEETFSSEKKVDAVMVLAVIPLLP
jgi:hypothetical protein